MKNISKELIAPCGMDCAICSGYLAWTHDLPKKRGKIVHCQGCRPRDKQCAFIKKDCASGKLLKNKIKYCFECKGFPCERLKKLNHRYQTKYHYSQIANLKFIKKEGIKKFLEKEAKEHKCPKCGDLICIHNDKCYHCDKIASWKE